ncbi:hypothetical protein BGZ70_001848 [Mortierella alpina]|uniref:CHY-type domain-containing protein n=1 Tax=Mortierella alpina TaxID=64518 RepID=A0A9P6M5Q6_MORAP|nr:hypothetical protein BGZ70_001848 [Mortierella alpina]
MAHAAASTSTAAAAPRASPCQFFHSKKGCRKGSDCRFVHATNTHPAALPPPAAAAAAPSTPTEATLSLPPARTPRPRPPARAPVRKPVPRALQNLSQDNAAASLRAFEISQVQSRFVQTFVATDDTRFQLHILPSDPDFPYEIQSLHVQLTVPPAYPGIPCSVAVLNKDIPKGFATNLERGFADAARQPKSLLAHLNWLDANMEQLLQKPPAPTIRFIGRGSSQPAGSSSSAASSSPSPSPSLPPPLPKPVSSSSSARPSTSSPSHSVPTATTRPVSHTPKPPPPTFTADQIEQAGLQRQKQLNQIQARFRSSFESISTTNVRIALESPGREPLWINLLVPKVFPLEPCSIRLNEDDRNLEIESWQARNVEQGFRKIVTASPQLSLFQLLNQLNRDLKDLLNMPQLPTTASAPSPSSSSPLSSYSPSSVTAEHHAASQLVEQPSSVTQKTLASGFMPKEQEDGYRNPKLIYVDASPKIPRRNFDQGDDQGMATSEDEDDEDSQSDSDEECSSGSETGSDDSSDDDGDGDDHAAEEDDPTTTRTDGPSSTESSPKRGIEIRMPDLTLDHISLLHCRSLSLLVRCNRCKGLTEIPDLLPDDGRPIAATGTGASGSDKRKWKTCENCQSVLGAHFRAEYVHIQSRTLGYVDLAGCTAFDLLPSAFVPTCSECDQVLGSTAEHSSTLEIATGSASATPSSSSSSAAAPGFRQRIGRGMSATANCRRCHVRMTFTMEGEIKFVKQSPGDLMRASAATLEQLPLKKKAARHHHKSGLDFELKVGEPLPRKGACDHYKKSRRWFRFPCCSKIYPCHICHDVKEADSHECDYAKRMICGHCSREQTVSDKACVCGESPVKTTGVSGAYWEGGQGMRDKTKMSTKDARKYRGANKTVAKKQVGAENVRKRAPKH